MRASKKGDVGGRERLRRAVQWTGTEVAKWKTNKQQRNFISEWGKKSAGD